MDAQPQTAATPEATKPRIREVVAALILRGDQVFICQRKAGTAMGLQWEFPGGKVEPGETPEQALRRELDEELGIRADIGVRIAEIEHHYRNGGAIHLKFFAVHQFEGEIQNRIFEDTRWADLRDLPAFNFLAADKKFVRDLANGKIL
jgi:8-oxo-dGTP diphosphatase